ncbi:MAG: PilZ domain-containing protein [Deltaproteobacteria bacterium]|jgi:uncharacterized protein (TIGR02266 family)|nr:PilZ domain-containing protein [Deltaproteobacteria bacterium]
MEEHTRQHRRAKVSLPVTIETEQETLERITYNISPDGAFIRGQSPLELHEVIDMIISGPDRRITVKARVVWSSNQVPPEQDMPRGMGVEFIKISDEDRKFISSFISGRDFAVYLKSAASDKDESPESLKEEQLVEEEKEKDERTPAQEPPKKCPRGHKHLSWSADEDYLFCWDCNREYSLAECRDQENAGSAE